MEKPSDKEKAKAIEFARNQYCDDDLEIDDKPKLSCADGGIWVAAWVWVSDGDIEGEQR